MKRRLGDPGESLAKAHLQLVMNCEVQTGTANDDDDKIDARIVYVCPFTFCRRELRCQIKTGNSFGKWTRTKQRFRINLESDFRQTLRRNADPTLLVWIPEVDCQPLYVLIPPHRTTREPIYIHATANVSPATLFDVARQHHIFTERKRTRQVNFVGSASLAMALKKCKQTLIQGMAFADPKVVRNVRLPNSSLRHITRNSRPSSRRRLSLDTIQYLPRLLERTPRTSQTLIREIRNVGKRTLTESLLLLNYPTAFKDNFDNDYGLFVRVREVISYPKDWTKSLLCLSGPGKHTVESRATLESWYLKREANG